MPHQVCDIALMHADALAVLLAISRERGVEHIRVYPKSVNKKKFLEFLEELRGKNFFADIML